jgi:hypothetical protein
MIAVSQINLADPLKVTQSIQELSAPWKVAVNFCQKDVVKQARV